MEIRMGYRVELYRDVAWHEIMEREEEPPSDKLIDELLALANWIDEQPYAIHYYPKSIEDGWNVRQKAIEIYDKYGYNGKQEVHLVQLVMDRLYSPDPKYKDYYEDHISIEYLDLDD